MKPVTRPRNDAGRGRASETRGGAPRVALRRDTDVRGE